MAVEYDKSGIHFQYPDNWVLDETTDSADCQAVTVYSPSGAFWTVSRHSRMADVKELARAAVEAMRGEYAEVEVEEVQDTLAGHELFGFDISFYYVDLINTAAIRTLRSDHATFSIFYQAEDRELATLEDVFGAMTTDFLRNLPISSFLE